MPSSSAREVRFGFFVFDNADGMYGVYSETHALKAAANVITDALTEADGEFMYYILSSSNDSEAYCFRFEGSAAMPATTDTIHAIVKLLKGDNDSISHSKGVIHVWLWEWITSLSRAYSASFTVLIRRILLLEMDLQIFSIRKIFPMRNASTSLLNLAPG